MTANEIGVKAREAGLLGHFLITMTGKEYQSEGLSAIIDAGGLEVYNHMTAVRGEDFDKWARRFELTEEALYKEIDRSLGMSKRRLVSKMAGVRRYIAEQGLAQLNGIKRSDYAKAFFKKQGYLDADGDPDDNAAAFSADITALIGTYEGVALPVLAGVVEDPSVTFKASDNKKRGRGHFTDIGEGALGAAEDSIAFKTKLGEGFTSRRIVGAARGAADATWDSSRALYRPKNNPPLSAEAREMIDRTAPDADEVNFPEIIHLDEEEAGQSYDPLALESAQHEEGMKRERLSRRKMFADRERSPIRRRMASPTPSLGLRKAKETEHKPSTEEKKLGEALHRASTLSTARDALRRKSAAGVSSETSY